MPSRADISNVRCLQDPVGTNVSVWSLCFRPHKQRNREKKYCGNERFCHNTPSPVIQLRSLTQGFSGTCSLLLYSDKNWSAVWRSGGIIFFHDIMHSSHGPRRSLNRCPYFCKLFKLFKAWKRVKNLRKQIHIANCHSVDCRNLSAND